MSLGSHMLGALEPEEAVQVEAHLAACPECRAEFEELSGLSAMLGKVSEEDIEHASSPPHAVLDRLIAASAKRRRVHRLMLGLAASLTAVVVGGTVWVAVSNSRGPEIAGASAPVTDSAAGNAAKRGVSDPQAQSKQQGYENGAAEDSGRADALAVPSPSQSAMMRTEAALPWKKEQGRVRAELSLAPGGGGTAIQVMLSGVAEGTRCRLVAIGTDGTESPAGSWKAVATSGYQPGPGYTDLAPDRIARFDIRTSTGKLLISIRPPAG